MDTSPTVVKFPALAVLLMVSVLPVIPVAELSRPSSWSQPTLPCAVSPSSVAEPVRASESASSFGLGARPAPRLRSWSEAGSAASVLERGRLRGFGLGARPAPRLRSWSEAGSAASVLEPAPGPHQGFFSDVTQFDLPVKSETCARWSQWPAKSATAS